MGVAGRLPRTVVFRYADWRATRIEDPIERLRFLRETVGPALAPRAPAGAARRARLPALLALLLLPTSSVMTNNAMIPIAPDESIPAAATQAPRVWLVEQSDQQEVYSNGLRIERQYETENEPRLYQVLDRSRNCDFAPDSHTEPAGIVYHTTESLLEPFEAERNRQLKRAGEELLTYIQRHRAYHFVIDRFGRVFRVVREQDTANHAGNSIWADRRWAYLNLNTSFLAVAFEARSRGQNGAPSVSAAQVHSGHVLTDMLRSKYHLLVTNCVTHAQVSVNPSNLRIAYHTDWAKDFPYTEMGLTDNYSIPLPSIAGFGFTFESYLVKLSGGRPWRGLLAAESQLRGEAASRNWSVTEYRAALQQRYRERLAALKSKAATEEMN